MAFRGRRDPLTTNRLGRCSIVAITACTRMKAKACDYYVKCRCSELSGVDIGLNEDLDWVRERGDFGGVVVPFSWLTYRALIMSSEQTI